MAGKRNADALLSASTNANLADEALYRHYPPVNRPASSSSSSGAGGSILDTANTDTFETLNQKLASRWCSPPAAQPSAPSSSSSSSCCPQTSSSSSSSSGGNVMKCLTDKVQHHQQQASPVSPSPASATQNGGCGPHQQGASSSCGSAQQPTSSQLLFLVRHGETDMNKAGKLQGRGINAHLNAAGLAQAQGLGRFVRNVPFDTVTSSSLYRAHEVGDGTRIDILQTEQHRGGPGVCSTCFLICCAIGIQG